MVDGAPTSDPANEPAQHEELPDRIRVHQLARSLGNTTKEVLEALLQIDGQARNVSSGVDREDALRVRDMLFATHPVVIPTFSSAEDASAATPAEEPESGPVETKIELPHYMPLFVSPQPIEAAKTDAGYAEDEAGDDADDSDLQDADDDDEDQADKPNRRRRRGRRGRGRGRGEQGGSDGQTGDDSG
ncbi:MAG: translation initiation factor IF-2 N-terminal domain-containing protein, partial [Mycobacterium sp.]